MLLKDPEFTCVVCDDCVHICSYHTFGSWLDYVAVYSKKERKKAFPLFTRLFYFVVKQSIHVDLFGLVCSLLQGNRPFLFIKHVSFPDAKICIIAYEKILFILCPNKQFTNKHKGLLIKVPKLYFKNKNKKNTAPQHQQFPLKTRKQNKFL